VIWFDLDQKLIGFDLIMCDLIFDWGFDLNHFCKRFVICTCDLICDLYITDSKFSIGPFTFFGSACICCWLREADDACLVSHQRDVDLLLTSLLHTARQTACGTLPHYAQCLNTSVVRRWNWWLDSSLARQPVSNVTRRSCWYNFNYL